MDDDKRKSEKKRINNTGKGFRIKLWRKGSQMKT